MTIICRTAYPEEAHTLSALALRAKAYWPYDADFIAACQSALTLTPDYITRHCVRVLANVDNNVLGFYSLFVSASGRRELDYMFVAPEFIGRGYGRLLWCDAAHEAQKMGWDSFYIVSDPHAVEFYRMMGAEDVGEEVSSVAPERGLPLLCYYLKSNGLLAYS